MIRVGFLALVFSVITAGQGFGGLITVGPSSSNILADWFSHGSYDKNHVYSTAVFSSNSGANDTTPDLGTYTNSANNFQFQFAIEDTNDNAGNGGYVGPRYGGQDYDAEFLGVGTDMNRLVVAIVSGQRPDNGSSNYAPGDLYIRTSSGVYGVELTGENYTLNNSGHTSGSPTTSYTAGSVVFANNGEDSWIDAHPELSGELETELVQLKYGSSDNTVVGSGPADIFFTASYSDLDPRSVFELAIDFSFFDGAEIQSIHWSPSCGNDILRLNFTSSIPTEDVPAVPEPASLLLFGIGAAGCGAFARRRRSSSDVG